MDLYSSLLLSSIFVLGAALLASLGARRVRLAAQIRRPLALAGLGLVLITTIQHYLAGHATGTAAPMPPIEFVAAHPILPTLGVIAVVLLAWNARPHPA